MTARTTLLFISVPPIKSPESRTAPTVCVAPKSGDTTPTRLRSKAANRAGMARPTAIPGISIAGMLRRRFFENSRGLAVPTPTPIRTTAPTQRVTAAAAELSRLLPWVTDRARTSRMANWRAVRAARANPNRDTLALVIPSVAKRALPTTARRVPATTEADQCSLRKMVARTTDHTGTVPSMMAERDGPAMRIAA